jgi:hypothetical protein
MIPKIILAIAMVVEGGATVVQADLAEFNAINAAARAARERGKGGLRISECANQRDDCDCRSGTIAFFA